MAIWLSYSAFHQYQNCPKQYYLQRVKKEAPPEPDSKHNAVVGTIVQRVFEDFYNKELWRKGKETSAELLKRAEVYFDEFMDTEYVNFDDVTCRYKHRQEPLEEILEIIPKTLTGIKRERFLGPYAKSEVDMKVRFNQGDFLVGYLDFVIRRQNDEVLIIDGKSSKHREKNVDVKQLYFYALMFYLRYRQLPDKIGFFYYRFADDPELAMDWVPVERSHIKDISEEIREVMDGIRARKFEAKPKASFCQWCPWERVCAERQAQLREGREKRAAKDTHEIQADFTKGPVTIGFGDLVKKK